MPLIRVDAHTGRTPEQIGAVLDAVHRAVLGAFAVPERDRYQIYQEHQPGRLVIEDAGLGIPRSSDALIVSVVSRPRPVEQKQAFYSLLVEELGSCGIRPSDVVASIVGNADADWSFGSGRAQFLTGEL